MLWRYLLSLKKSNLLKLSRTLNLLDLPTNYFKLASIILKALKRAGIVNIPEIKDLLNKNPEPLTGIRCKPKARAKTAKRFGRTGRPIVSAISALLVD